MTSPSSKLNYAASGLRTAAVSDVGMRRASNQDSLVVALAEDSRQWHSRGHLFVVADGMGAHAAGELASQLATDNIPLSYQKRSELAPAEALGEAVREANQLIHNKGQNSVDFQGMGTTCSCLLLLPCGAVAAHVGDSRIYRYRDDVIEQLTFDHSLVWEMAAAGNATEEEVPDYVPKNVITRSLGPNATVMVDLEGPFPMQSGDRYLLCSDGLTGPLKPELIGMVLGSLPSDEAAQTLVDLANLLGGPDNITVVVAEVLENDRLGAEEKPNGFRNSLRRKEASSGRGLLAWSALAVCVVLCGVFLTLGQPALAVASGVGIFVSGLLAFTQRGGHETAGIEPLRTGSRGKAPYRSYPCSARPENIETLNDIVRQLEDLEGQRDWDFDWQAIQDDRQQAHEALARSDFRSAVVAYCSAVRRLMEEVRQRRPDQPSDSSVNLR